MHTVVASGKEAMFFSRLTMNIVTTQADYRFLALNYHVSNILHHMPVSAAQVLHRGIGEVDREVTKEIITRHEGIRVGQPGALR